MLTLVEQNILKMLKKCVHETTFLSRKCFVLSVGNFFDLQLGSHSYLTVKDTIKASFRMTSKYR